MRYRSLALAFVVGFSLSAAVHAAPVQGADDSVRPRAVIGDVLAHIAQAVKLTGDQQAAVMKIVLIHREDVLAARARGDSVTVVEILREAAQEVVDVLTPEQRAIAQDEIKKALADRGLSVPPQLESLLQ